MYYTERLQWIRDCKNITQKKLWIAKIKQQQQYTRYEKGIIIMSITRFIEICKYLNVSADYILGFKEEINAIKKKKNYESMILSVIK